MSLVIKNKQFAEYDRNLTEKYVIQLAAELRGEFPEDVADFDDGELRYWVKEGIERAEEYGFEADADVGAFVKLLFTVGWEFDQHELMHHFLTEEDYQTHERLTFMFDAATAEDWEAAALIGEDNDDG